MDEDNTTNTPGAGPNQPVSSSGDTPQGASGAQSQGNPTPTSAQSSNTPSSGPTMANTQHSKRRRGLGVVTPNACTECRKKRAKPSLNPPSLNPPSLTNSCILQCDGHNPCGRCKAQKDVECFYEVPVRQSKENLRAEIENLRLRQRSNDQGVSPSRVSRNG
ncbi:hypothetical protein G7Z17_g12386 [Cylindrodendrum hubeiense]|uniref:Zn(2)-C6 fungal-type domain-containing protein n=1 Tax=Cylindrodendrum hubeiense TaxID=595255 RepID=A0A9P5H106_9HYPO|nr:hypothetical protein G7Z17_g12386 [Cylindrodendrum hubeiense]